MSDEQDGKDRNDGDREGDLKRLEKELHYIRSDIHWLQSEVVDLKVNSALALDQPKSTTAGRIVNSPFVVTVLGGIAIAVISYVIQGQMADSERQMNIELQQLEEMETVATSFSEDMISYLQLAQPLFKRNIWLSQWQDDDAKTQAIYPDGRDFLQTRDFAEAQFDRLQELPKPESLISRVRIAFPQNESLIKVLQSLQLAVREHQSASSQADLDTHFVEVHGGYEEVVTILAVELDQAKQGDADGG